jgi:hypothetical protein
MPVSKNPNPPLNARITDLNGSITPLWQAWFEQSWTSLVKQVTDMATTIAALQQEVKRNAISSSSTVPTALLTQADTGTAVRITMAAHTRLYDGGSQVEVSAAFVDAPYVKDVALYYDDPELDGGVVAMNYTLIRAEAQANYVPGRHFLGAITTIAAGAPPVTVPDGGTYPPGGGSHTRWEITDLS